MMKTAALILSLFAALAAVAGAADAIEFLNGTKLEGSVVAIHKERREVEFEAAVGGAARVQAYPYAAIHAVVWKEKRYVVNERPATGGEAVPKRTEQQVNDLIAKAGSEQPLWFDGTRLTYPDTLDLSWPMPAPQPWDNQKNVGQFIWDIINPNPDRWRSGVRLMHFLLSRHANDAEIRKRAMTTLGGMYFRLFQDYARAAFWWREAGIDQEDPLAVNLAECYWRLGNKKMAEKLLDHNLLRPDMIKLWGDMGETAKALEIAERYVKAGGMPHDAYLNAADACRLAGRTSEAVAFYEKVINTPATGRTQKRDERTQDRARASRDAIRRFDLLDLAKIPDGKYRDESLGYEGQVKVEVRVKGGRIESADVTEHKEKQFYSALTDVPAQIVVKQGVKGVDATSGATITAEAIINAAAKALAEATR